MVWWMAKESKNRLAFSVYIAVYTSNYYFYNFELGTSIDVYEFPTYIN